jgi:ribosomal protein S19
MKKSCEFCGFKYDLNARCQCDRNVDRMNQQEEDVDVRLRALYLKDNMVGMVVSHYNNNNFTKTYSREQMLIHIIENLVQAKDQLTKQIETHHKFCANYKILPE